MAAQFLVFLEKWSEIFPEYRDDDVSPFSREEVNGSFILRGSRMQEHIFLISLLKLSNITLSTEMYVLWRFNWRQHFKLKGLLIGNGWTDPAVQYPAYASYAYEHDLIKPGSDAGNQVEAALGQCRRKIESEGVHITIGDCENILNTILRLTNDQYPPNRCLN